MSYLKDEVLRGLKDIAAFCSAHGSVSIEDTKGQTADQSPWQFDLKGAKHE